MAAQVPIRTPEGDFEMRTQIIVEGTLALVLTGFLANFPVAQAAVDPAAGAGVSKTLSDAKNEAIQIKDDAQLLESLAWPETGAQAQGVVINQVRDHVNALAGNWLSSRPNEPPPSRGRRPPSTGSHPC